MENDGGQAPEVAAAASATGAQPDKPLGTVPMNTEVLKQPLGFMRCLQCFFAMVAFASCANYSSYTEYRVECKNDALTKTIKHQFSYPFRLDHNTPAVEVYCNANKTDMKTMYPPGDFKSDSEFFVFTGVVAFLGSAALVALYVFFSRLYMDEQKKAPLYDFVFTVMVSVFWLSASAAWANGVVTLKWIADPVNWIFDSDNSICQKSSTDAAETFINQGVKQCTATYVGTFGGANASVILGFLNFFLWASSLWFVYKETAWFANRGGATPGGSQPQQLSP